MRTVKLYAVKNTENDKYFVSYNKSQVGPKWNEDITEATIYGSLKTARTTRTRITNEGNINPSVVELELVNEKIVPHRAKGSK